MLKLRRMDSVTEKRGDKEGTSYDVQNQFVMNQKLCSAVSSIYLDTINFAKQYMEETGHQINFTPVFFIRTFKMYSLLLDERKRNVTSIQHRYEDGLAKFKAC